MGSKLAAVAVLIMAAGGCTGATIKTIGPDAAATEHALSITWEGVYGMERGSRPLTITWWATDGCGEEAGFAGTIDGACALDSESSNGNVYIRWEGSISASNWSRALIMWRQYLMTGTMTRPSVDDLALVETSNDSLGGL